MCCIANAIFIQAWKIFPDATLAQERRLALKKINQDLLTTAATEDAQMDIDGQPTLDNHTINDLINKKTSQQNKPMKADITWIKSKLAALEPKNDMRGPGGASKRRKKRESKTKTGRPKSRQCRQRFQQSLRKQEEDDLQQAILRETQLQLEQESQSLKTIRKQIILTFGFAADPSLTHRHNASIAIAMMPTWFYFARPSNMAFHDLTTFQKPPSNLRSLLGLSLIFIPTPQYSHSASYLSADKDSTLPQFKRDLKLRCYFASGDNPPADSSDNCDYNPRMYVKSKSNPAPWAVPQIVDDRHTAFARRV
jgi:hypothetical protein